MNKILLIAVFISFVNALSIAVIVPIIYVYAKSYGLSDFESSLLITLYSLFQFLATPIIGRLSDYYGRKPLLAISLIGTVIANLLTAFAPTALFLFLARMLDGVTGGNNSVAQAVISDTTKPEDRAKAFGLFGASFGLAFIVGPIISLFVQQYSLAAPYVFASAMALIAALVTIFVLPETLKKKETKKLELGNLGFTQILSGLTIPVIGVLLAVNFLSSLSIGIFQFSFQPYIINILQRSSTDIAVILVLYGIISVIMQAGVIRILLKRFSQIKLLIAGLVISGILFALFPSTQNFSIFMILITLFAITGSLSRPIIISLISVNTKAEDQGVSIGLAESYFSLASTIGPIIGGIAIGFGYGYPLIIGGVISIATGIFVYSKRMRLHPVKKADF